MNKLVKVVFTHSFSKCKKSHRDGFLAVKMKYLIPGLRDALTYRLKMTTQAGSSNHSEEEFVPNAKQAAELVSQFATITGTDTACAQFYLQDRDWDLQVKPF